MKTEAEIREWLIARIAKLAKLEAAHVKADEEFQRYGVSSVRLVEMSGELEDFAGLRVDPTIFWEHPTIDALSRHLGSQK